MAQHRPTGSETIPPYAPRSSRFGSEPPSVEDDVDVWRYAIFELHARNDDDEKTQHFIYTASCDVLRVKIHADTLAVCNNMWPQKWKNSLKLPNQGCITWRIWEDTHILIGTKFCMWVDICDIVKCTIFGDDHRRVWACGGQIFPFFVGLYGCC